MAPKTQTFRRCPETDRFKPAIANPRFSRWGTLTPKVGASTYCFGQLSPKTAWKWRKNESRGACTSLLPPCCIRLMLKNWIPRFIETFLTLKYTLRIFSTFLFLLWNTISTQTARRQAVGSERDDSVNLSKRLWRWVWLIGLSAHFVFFCFHCLFYVICKQYQRGLRRRRQQTFYLFFFSFFDIFSRLNCC